MWQMMLVLMIVFVLAIIVPRSVRSQSVDSDTQEMERKTHK